MVEEVGTTVGIPGKQGGLMPEALRLVWDGCSAEVSPTPQPPGHVRHPPLGLLVLMVSVSFVFFSIPLELLRHQKRWLCSHPGF